MNDTASFWTIIAVPGRNVNQDTAFACVPMNLGSNAFGKQQTILLSCNGSVIRKDGTVRTTMKQFRGTICREKKLGGEDYEGREFFP